MTVNELIRALNNVKDKDCPIFICQDEFCSQDYVIIVSRDEEESDVTIEEPEEIEE